MHNGPFQVLILFLKSFKDGTHLTLGVAYFKYLLLHIAVEAFHTFWFEFVQ